MNENINWKEKCRQVQKRYEQLSSVRHDFIRKDIETLKKRIMEHKKTHEEIVNDILRENDVLKKEIDGIQSIKEKILNLKESNSILKRELGLRDPILYVLLKYKFLIVSCIGRNKFRINTKDNQIIFELQKGEQYTDYYPIRIPPSSKFSNFLKQNRIPNLEVFCENLRYVIEKM